MTRVWCDNKVTCENHQITCPSTIRVRVKANLRPSHGAAVHNDLVCQLRHRSLGGLEKDKDKDSQKTETKIEMTLI